MNTKRLLTVLCAIVLSIQENRVVRGQSCSLPWKVEALIGNGSDQKVGFICGTNCGARYFRVENASTSITWDVTENHEFPPDSNYTRKGSTEVTSSTGRYLVITETGPCTRTVTTNGPMNADIYSNYRDTSGFYVNIGSYGDSCRYMETNGVTVYGTNSCFGPPLWTPYMTETKMFPCGPSRTIHKYSMKYGTDSYYGVETVYTGPGFVDEYTTSQMVDRARACAMHNIKSQSFTNCGGCDKNATASVTIGAGEDTADVTVSKWRVAIEGAEAKEYYTIVLLWEEIINGKATYTTNRLTRQQAPSSLIWYYPGEAGEYLFPTVDEDCGYSYTKRLFDMSITPEGNSPPSGCNRCLGGSGGPGPRGSSFGDSSGEDESFSGGSLLSIDLGAGDYNASLGRLALVATSGSDSLASANALRFDGFFSADELEILRGPDRILQVSAPRLFIDITNTTDASYVVRVMKKEAQGDYNGFGYDWDASSSYLIREYRVDNPDAGVTNNRVRIREVTTSKTNEWLYTYTSTNAGWNITLPDGSGSIDLVSTNHASDAYTTIRRYRNASNGIIEQNTQIYTNFPWGNSLVQETAGVGGESRTRNLSYYIGDTNAAPFAPDPSHIPLKSIEEADGSWRYFAQYTTNGLVITELQGIDSALSSNSNLCLRTEYSYASQDGSDTLTREPQKPRKIDVYWKGTLIQRTYHVYTDDVHKIIECPNPNNAIGAGDNLVNQTHYDSGTTLVIGHTFADGTIETVSWSGSVKTVDVGESDGMGGVANGTRTVTTRTTSGAIESIESWDINGGMLGVQTKGTVFSDFDEFDRAQEQVELGSLTTTWSYDCCGLGSSTDPDGVVTTYFQDALRRTDLISKWNIVQQKVFDAASRVVEERRSGTNGSTIRLHSHFYDTTGFETIQTNALGGITTTARSKMTNGFDQILTTYPDGGTNLQKFWADGRLERSLGNASAPIRYIYGVTNVGYLGGSNTFQYEMSIKLDSSGTDTGEWEVSCFDGVGRLVKRILPGPAQYTTAYNALGQKISESDPDGVTRLFRYDAEGELIVTAVDVDLDGYVDDYEGGQSGWDRVTSHVSYYLATAAGGNSRGMDIHVDDTYVWTTAGSSATSRVSRVERSTDGLFSWNTTYRDQSTPLTTSSGTTYSGTGTRFITNAAPNGVKSITQLDYGRPIIVTERDSGGSQITRTDLYYDAHGRRYQLVDARNGATTFTYNNADQVATVTSPLPGTGQAAQTTTTSFDASLRAVIITQPDGLTVTNEYTKMGLLLKTSGARTYPVAYTYDAQGRMKTMTTWHNAATSAGAAVTTWNYDSNRGWLANKRYDDNTGPTYTYTAGGRLHSRTWARTGTGGNPMVTTYTNSLTSTNVHGDLGGILYVNTPMWTPDVTYTYDRRGRKIVISSSNAALNYRYYDNDVVGTNSHSSGPINGLVITKGYDSAMQLTSIGANTSASVSQSFTYDNAGRMSVATDGSYSATYSYAANSRLVSQIVYKTNTTTRLTTTKKWDYLNRLLETTGTPSTTSELPTHFKYAYNNANQRINATLSDGSYWIYQYDKLGQVISGDRYWADGTLVAGQQYDYRFDDIGNRTSAKWGGDAAGQNLQSYTNTPGPLNQYTNRNVPAVASVLGIASAGATVTVNGQSTYRKGEYFWKELAVTNSATSVWLALTNTAVNGASSSNVVGGQYIAKTVEAFSYDTDGNLTGDGRWNYYWDGENRLVQMISATTNGPQQRIVFYYDPLGRRLRKNVWNNTSGTNTPVVDIKFVYEGWNLIAELDNLSSNSAVRRYLWGHDLSGTRDRAGGVGGLLAEKDSSGVAHFPVFDGNGNVARLVAGDTGNYSATYEYGPFGETIRASGSNASANPIRFSTKYCETESGSYHYGHRFYEPESGWWLSRDPVDSQLELNKYGFILNNPTSYTDLLGLAVQSWPMSEFPIYKNDPPGNPTAGIIHDGCIGLTHYIQGSVCGEQPNVTYPEDAKGTKCFATEAQADAYKCPKKTTSRIKFAKQGKWKNDKPPKPNKEGSVPNDSIGNPPDPTGFEYYNYVTHIDQKYCWMTGALRPGLPMPIVYCDDKPPILPAYPNVVWCITCKKCK